ncbi:MAG: hypothetical protein Q8Q86_03850 [Candidatus Daviesbacteria bacterium]|nr:hypothetical protein [Candidatus Daviesbacteria bacterium]
MGKFNFKDETNFETTKAEAEKFYATIGAVRCPYFGEKIAFNVKGIKHLRFKSDEVARSHEDQYSRLKLVYLAPEVLKLSRTVQGIWHTKHFEIQKTNSRWEKVLKDVSFYEFMAVLENVRVKVIVKQVSGGEKHFWSIIPFWGINKEISRRVLHSGNLENDL